MLSGLLAVVDFVTCLRIEQVCGLVMRYLLLRDALFLGCRGLWVERLENGFFFFILWCCGGDGLGLVLFSVE